MQQQIQTFYQSHHAWLVGWLKRRLGCIHHAHDLAHDTFLRVLTKSITLSSLQEPRAFLRTIAQGLVIDQFRRQALEQAYLQALMHAPEALAPSPEEYLAMIDILMQLDRLFHGLKPAVRHAFLLSRLEGMTYPEIAIAMKVSLRTVETNMAIALRHILAIRSA